MERTKAQRMMARLLRAKGLAVVENVHLPGGEADILLPHYKVIVELDGYFHLSSEAKTRDQRKESCWIEHGYQVFRFRNEEIYSKNDLCLKRIMDHIRVMEGVADESLGAPLKDHELLKRMHRSLLAHEKMLKNIRIVKPNNPKINPEAYFLSLDIEQEDEKGDKDS